MVFLAESRHSRLISRLAQVSLPGRGQTTATGIQPRRTKLHEGTARWKKCQRSREAMNRHTENTSPGGEDAAKLRSLTSEGQRVMGEGRNIFAPGGGTPGHSSRDAQEVLPNPSERNEA